VCYLTLENLAECDIDEAARRQCLKHAVGKVYARTGTDRLEYGCREKESDWIHQSICHSGNDDWLVAVVNTDKLKAKAECNHCLVDKVADENRPNLSPTNTMTLQSINI